MRTLLLAALVSGAMMSAAAAASRSKVSVAAAANLTFAVQALNAEFARAEPEIAVSTTLGSSGTLFAQIKNGAPFDVFLSADTAYPERLVATGGAGSAAVAVFATGRLVVWTIDPKLDLTDLARLVRSAAVPRIAIAQSTTAPYGRAAEQALRTLGLWDVAKPKLVVGENIAQTAQFVETGNAALGFVALSLVQANRLAREGHWVEVPPALYAPVSLAHGCVLTTRGAANPAAKKYLTFLASPAARRILAAQGYTVDAANSGPR